MTKKYIISLCLVLFIMGTHASFALSLSSDSEFQQAEIDLAPVMIDDFFLFRVRGIEAYTAKERARDIVNSIKKIASNPQIKTENITVVESDLFSNIMAGKELVMALVDADATLEQVGRGVLAHTYASKIKEAIKRYRDNRKPDRINRTQSFVKSDPESNWVYLFAARALARHNFQF